MAASPEWLQLERACFRAAHRAQSTAQSLKAVPEQSLSNAFICPAQIAASRASVWVVKTFYITALDGIHSLTGATSWPVINSFVQDWLAIKEIEFTTGLHSSRLMIWEICPQIGEDKKIECTKWFCKLIRVFLLNLVSLSLLFLHFKLFHLRTTRVDLIEPSAILIDPSHFPKCLFLGWK